MSADQMPANSTQHATTQSRPDLSLADLIRLRDQGRFNREENPMPLAVGEAVERLRVSPKERVPTGQGTVPAGALALRRAAREPDLRESETFAKVAGNCIDVLRRKLDARYSPQRAGLDQYRIYDLSGLQKAALECVRSFIGGLESVLHETRGMILYGSVGTGKDHLLAWALYRVAEAGIPTSWVSGEDIYARIRDSMDNKRPERDILAPFLCPTVLGISDPVSPTGSLGEWDTRILARLLDQRYRALKLTWLTMNASNEADAKGKLTSLVWDRFQEDALIVPCFWPSFRGLKR